MVNTISLLGSTGSIGRQTLDVCREQGIQVAALSAHSSVDLLEQQAREFHPQLVAVYELDAALELARRLSDLKIEVVYGLEGLRRAAALPESEAIVTAVVGMAALWPTMAAIEAGKRVAFANKETLVCAGELVMETARRYGAEIIPVDSEHSAIFQCLQGNKRSQLSKIILTASGGPFFGKTYEELSAVTKAQALRHPNWDMGSKITIDSATLMNKGLEFIEAKWLFDLDPDQIEIVVHRQSVVHSAVEFDDYAVIAQLGVPDMKIPIQYALLYPERKECPTGRLSLTDYGTLTFEKPDFKTFKCLSAAIEAITKGGAYPCLVNSANEEAVKAFLNDEISFIEIGDIVSSVQDKFEYSEISCYEDVMAADRMAREFVRKRISG